MKAYITFLLLIAFLFTFPSLFGQHTEELQAGAETFPKIRAASQALSQALQTENLEAIRAFSLPQTLILPEYHTALENAGEIEAYYRTFFKQSLTKSYSKKILEIQQIQDFFLEIGTFTHSYIIQAKDSVDYQGKYMTWWKKDSQNQVKLIANMWGSTRWLPTENLDFVSVHTATSKPVLPSTGLAKQVYQQIDFVAEAVQAGNAQKQLTTYLDDAIYMTYYEPACIGKQAITDYFEKHYGGGGFTDSLSIKPHRIIDMNDYILSMGKYYVAWKQEGKPYFIRGKNLTLYQKMEDNSLKIYRQMVNHSHEARQKANP